MPTFSATKQRVFNRGVPADEFLWPIIDWAREAPMCIFQKNDVLDDIYSRIVVTLGPWTSDDKGVQLLPFCFQDRTAKLLIHTAS